MTEHRQEYIFPGNTRDKIVWLIDCIQEAAASHANKLGFGINVLNEQGIVWMLIDINLQLYTRELPRTITVNTWPSGVQKFYAYRDLKILNIQGEEVATATTTWLMANMITRKIIRQHPLIDSIKKIPVEKRLPRGDMKFEWRSSKIAQTRMTVGKEFIDQNGHVNNTFYVEWSLSNIPANVIKNKFLQKLSFQFVREGFENDELSVILLSENNLTLFHYLIDVNTEKRLALGKSVWT